MGGGSWVPPSPGSLVGLGSARPESEQSLHLPQPSSSLSCCPRAFPRASPSRELRAGFVLVLGIPKGLSSQLGPPREAWGIHAPSCEGAVPRGRKAERGEHPAAGDTSVAPVPTQSPRGAWVAAPEEATPEGFSTLLLLPAFKK